jgi:hypothetical protein
MLKIIRPKIASQTAVVTGSKRKNRNNPNNIRRVTRRHFRNKMREYLKDKIDDIPANSKNKNIGDVYRETNDFKTCYQRRSSLVKDENGDLLADPHNILDRNIYNLAVSISS